MKTYKPNLASMILGAMLSLSDTSSRQARRLIGATKRVRMPDAEKQQLAAVRRAQRNKRRLDAMNACRRGQYAGHAIHSRYAVTQ